MEFCSWTFDVRWLRDTKQPPAVFCLTLIFRLCRGGPIFPHSWKQYARWEIRILLYKPRGELPWATEQAPMGVSDNESSQKRITPTPTLASTIQEGGSVQGQPPFSSTSRAPKARNRSGAEKKRTQEVETRKGSGWTGSPSRATALVLRMLALENPTLRAARGAVQKERLHPMLRSSGKGQRGRWGIVAADYPNTRFFSDLALERNFAKLQELQIRWEGSLGQTKMWSSGFLLLPQLSPHLRALHYRSLRRMKFQKCTSWRPSSPVCRWTKIPSCIFPWILWARGTGWL